MQINRDIPATQWNAINEIADQTISLNGEKLSSSAIVAKRLAVKDISINTLDDIDTSLIELIVDYNPDILLLGTGTHFKPPNPTLATTFYKHNIPIDIMTTHAAARTYGLLASDGRNVMALLIL